MSIHILAIGQSNIANHCGSIKHSEYGKVLFNGQLVPLEDPIPGGSGTSGSVWPRLAESLYNQGYQDKLRVTLTAQGGASIDDWAPGGIYFDILNQRSNCGDLNGVTHVVFQQGEKDTMLKTSKEKYISSFLSLHYSVIDLIGDLPWIICESSYRFGETSTEVTVAQEQLAHSLSRATLGPNLDLLGTEYRTDNTHFNDRGLVEFANALSIKILEFPAND